MPETNNPFARLTEGVPQRSRQQTRIQKPRGESFIADVLGFDGPDKGFGRPAPGTLTTYRKMRNDPTGALAKMIATGPIRAAAWAVEVDEDVSEDIQSDVEDQFLPHREPLVEQAMRALEYGFQAWELVWDVRDGRIVIDKFKALLPDDTKVVVDEFGNYAGLENGKVKLLPVESLWYAHDKECDDWYGRSRYENYRQTGWQAWLDIQKQQGIYVTRAAGPTMLIHYPMGESKDASGSTVDNYEIAAKLAAMATQAKHLLIPNELMKWAEDVLHNGGTVADLRSWQFEWMETKTSHGADFLDAMRYYDSLTFRAWLIPERTALEGQFGTKAEAGVHAAIGLMGIELTQKEMLRCLNRYAVDRYVVLNYGMELKGKVRLTAKAIDDDTAQMVSRLVEKVLGENPDLFESRIDTTVLYRQLGLPIGDMDAETLALPTEDDIRREAGQIGAEVTGRGNGQAE